LNAKIKVYIAGTTVREYGDFEPRLPDRLRRSIRRNFKVLLPRENILRAATRSKEIYDYGASIFTKFLGPPQGKYVDPKDVDIERLSAVLKKRYPREPKKVIDLIVWYLVMYEHLL
jgi:hypothetical protein